MMKRDLSSVCSVLSRVSVITTMGAAVVACSSSDSGPAATPSPEAGGGDSTVDQGIPDVKQDCEPMAYYGPMPCTDDAQCVQANGPGYRCDKSAGFADPCGNYVSWPMCVQSVDAGTPDAMDGCAPMTYYGPPPCTDDAECVAQNGAGWYCDKNAGFMDACGWVSWPMCLQSLDAGAPDATDEEPPAYYGPLDGG